MTSEWHVHGHYGDDLRHIMHGKEIIGTIRKGRPDGRRRWTWCVNIPLLCGREIVQINFNGPFLECVAFVGGVEAVWRATR